MLGWQVPLTHREFLAWQEWLRLDLNRPDRTDHHIMMVAKRVQEIHASLAVMGKEGTKAQKIELEAQQIRFGEQPEKDKPSPVTWYPKTKEDVMRMTAQMARIRMTSALKKPPRRRSGR